MHWLIAKSAASPAPRLTVKPRSFFGNSSYILIVDDDDHSRNAFQALLEAWGYEVEAADSGQRALTLAQCDHPFIAFIDLNMPGMNGCELAAQLRKLEPYRSKLFAMSANMNEAAENRLFDGRFQKPIDLNLIRNILRSSFSTGS